MDDKINQLLREKILLHYGTDINEAKVYFSTQNYAFIFENKPFMIRVSKTAHKSRSEILSELMWLDDLKSFTNTVCEPHPSLQGNYLEEFDIEGTTYRASMFRTARGNVKTAVDMNPMFFICVGELLGKIHKVSTNEQEIGMHYKRRSLLEKIGLSYEQHRSKLSETELARVNSIIEKVDSLPKETGIYGICHGDFHKDNFFVENNNIWVFDFDSCCYSHYLFDIATFIQDCLLHGYKAGEDMRKVIYENILPYFRIGYELNQNCSEGYWDELETFIALRAVHSFLALQGISECGIGVDLDQIKKFYSFIINHEDIIDGITIALGGTVNEHNG